MSDPNVFLAILGLLTYRLLFHSELQLTLFSLIFCMSCAWCVAQLTLAVIKGASNTGPDARRHCAAFINMMQGSSSYADAE